jgi:hypothetical protein
MTNSESLGAESATEPTTKPESADLNMSAGAEMLIERMKTNPDDFNFGGRFYKVRSVLEQEHAASGWISPRDLEALREAYGHLILEPKFSEWVYGEIFNPKEPEPVQNMYAQMQGQRAQMQNSLLQGTGMYSTAIGSAGISNASTNPSGVLTVNANSANPTITLGQTTLSESMLGQIKNKLGL